MSGRRQFVGLRISRTAGAVPGTADIEEGELAINTESGRIYARFGDAIRDITDSYSQGDIDQMLGTAAGLNVPDTGDASAEQVVKGSDTRLSDARPPTAHQHPWGQIDSKPATATRWPAVAEVSGLAAALGGKLDAANRYTDAEAVSAAQNSGAFDAAGAAADAVSSHVSGSDPHSQYVQKAPGKGLSPNEYTDADRDKLGGIEQGATADQTKADINALGIDADTVDGRHAADFDPAGSAARAEQSVRATIQRRPDPLLMHFL